ncbi:Alpha/Beta hydrolase protein [Coniella lustricola]|uniref:Alpha/Beta hydrolase protein n=1 Tax=Coniella lustricola TaxID=2025994 RepID=A0A2T3A8M4_9PEZI|nr:Alpha/Beta hydrolase protein [Coniella lustricola]
MFDNFEPISVVTQTSPEVTIRGLRSTHSSTADLPPLLLLHGFPQTLHIWHRVAPQLVSAFNVILLDLRGYGSSSCPAFTTDTTANKDGVIDTSTQYAKSLMARDCVQVMSSLGYSTFYLAAHDRGARVGHKLCVDHPHAVRRALFLDICPTLAMFEATDFEFAKAYFHWFMLIQPYPLPETMLLSNPRQIAEMFMGGRQGDGLGIFDKQCFEEYVKALGDKDTVHAMCDDYRAAATWDMDEQRRDLEEGRKIKCPLRVLWGKHGVVERCFDALEEWRKVTDDGVTVDGWAVESGHYIPEQAPDDVVSSIRDFFVEQ